MDALLAVGLGIALGVPVVALRNALTRNLSGLSAQNKDESEGSWSQDTSKGDEAL